MNKLFLGDFRDIFSNELKDYDFSEAVFITDPPYNIGFKYNEHNDAMSDDDYIEMLAEFQECRAVFIQYPEETMKYLTPALGIPDEIVSWCYNANINRRFRLVNFYNIKPDFSQVKQPYKNPTDKRVKALIDAGSRGTNSYDWWSDIQLVKNVSKEKTEHPCQIPEKLIERIILMTTEKGGLVIDPFCGSGTVPAVAKRLGRQFIGIEKSQEYLDIARNRVENVQVSLFSNPRPVIRSRPATRN